MQYFLRLHGNNGFANATHCYVIRTFPLLFKPLFPLAALLHGEAEDGGFRALAVNAVDLNRLCFK
jgi:hypothetical protein